MQVGCWVNRSYLCRWSVGLTGLTCAGGGVRLPEEAAVDLCAGDLGGPLKDVTGITLEQDTVSGLLAVPTAGPVGGQTWVVT